MQHEYLPPTDQNVADQHPDKVKQLAVQMQAADQRFADEPGLAEGRARQLEARRHHNTFDRLDQIFELLFVLLATEILAKYSATDLEGVIYSFLEILQGSFGLNLLEVFEFSS